MMTSQLNIENALLNKINPGDLNQKEHEIYLKHLNRFQIGRSAELLVHGFYSISAAHNVASNPEALALLKHQEPNQPVPTEIIKRKNDSHHVFDSHYYLNLLQTSDMISQSAVSWISGAILYIGDSLGDFDYFDHSPELELLYHLRNGVAHGNKFNILPSGIKRLQKHPANNLNAAIREPDSEFIISSALNGTKVLFDYIGAGDVLDLLQSIAVKLKTVEI